MRRVLMIMVVAVMAIGSGGCLGPLAMMAARGPEAMAKRMGQSAGYQATSNVASSAVGQEAATSADTMANIDRILREHPDAVNAGELEELKRDLADDLPGPDEQAEEGEPLPTDGMEADASLYPPLAPGASPHDRRSAPFTSPKRGAEGVLITDGIGEPEQPVQTRNRLRIERPVPVDQRWRISDQHRFHSPKLTSFGEETPAPPVQRLRGGVKYAQ